MALALKVERTRRELECAPIVEFSRQIQCAGSRRTRRLMNEIGMQEYH
jgi:hypothetical protein